MIQEDNDMARIHLTVIEPAWEFQMPVRDYVEKGTHYTFFKGS